VRLVLVFDPDARTVSAHAPDTEARTYAEADVLDGGSVLPGFRLRVAELFKTRR
jgi:hypothetical protein